MRVYCLVLVAILGQALFCSGQEEQQKGVEAGVQFTGLHVGELGEGAAGLGGRLGYRFLVKQARLGVETEFNYCPQNPSGNFGESQFFAGIKAGVAGQELGIFAKARPGFVRFGGADFVERNHGASTNFAFDAGGILEYYIRPHFGLRIDWGDTMIYFPDPVPTASLKSPEKAGLSHNLQGSLGLMFRL